MAPKTKVHAYLEIVESHYTAGVARLSIGSNYLLFALMADVRNGGGVKAVSTPKGFPIGISKGAEGHFAQMDEESDSGLHDRTWLDTAEAQKVLKGVDTFVPGMVAAVAAMEALEAKGSTPRLLLAFED